tara:strand:- start:588 stop:923 length:336 start_codon:yes stop_codon:yes gene_type:complete
MSKEKELQKFIDSVLISKSRVRTKSKYTVELYQDEKKEVIDTHIKRNTCRMIAEEFNSNTPFTIKEEEEDGNIIYSTNVIIMDTKLFKETLDTYIRLTPKEVLQEIRSKKL